MKRFILLFFVFCFSVLLSFLFAQSDQKSVTVSGYVSYEGRGAQPKNIEVRIANSYTQPVKANAGGFFNICLDCSETNNSYYLLLCKGEQLKDARVSVRNKFYPGYSNYDIGFRCAKDVPDSFRATNR